MDINSTTLMKAAATIAPQLGKSLPKDREEVVEAVNKYRNLLYNMYASHKLFDNYKVCCCVQKFSNNCNNPSDPCDDFYYGITIPDDMAGVVAAWEYNEPMTLRSRWREAHVGISTGGLTKRTLTQMPETSATERDLTTYSRLKIIANHDADEDKVVVIRGRDSNNSTITAHITLEVDGFKYTKSKFCKIDSVVLPDLCGHIELQTEEGCTLSVYYPHEHVPCYRRFKINSGTCSAHAILVQGTRNYKPLAVDTDIVEIGDILIIEAAGRYFRYNENSTDQEDIRRAQYDLTTMKGLLDGLVARHRGRMIQDGSPTSRARRGNINSGLQGHTKRRKIW